MAPAETLRRCVLRNVECIICEEPYGSEDPGVRIDPVILQCGHDLCQICSKRVPGSTCPVCRAHVSFSGAAKPFVEYIDPSVGAKKSTSESNLEPTALANEASRMLLRCERLRGRYSIIELQESTKEISHSLLGKDDGDPNHMKPIIHILSSVLTKLVDKLKFQTYQTPQLQGNALRIKNSFRQLLPISSRQDPEMSGRSDLARVDGFLHTPPLVPSTPASQHISAESTADLQSGLAINHESAHSASGQLHRSQGEGSNAEQLGSSVFSTHPYLDPSSPTPFQGENTSSSVFLVTSNTASDSTFTLVTPIGEIRSKLRYAALRANNNAPTPRNVVDQTPSSTNSRPPTLLQTESQTPLPSGSGTSRTLENQVGQCQNWATGGVRCTNGIVGNGIDYRGRYCDQHRRGGEDYRAASDGRCRGTKVLGGGGRCESRYRRYAAYCHYHDPQ